MENHLRVIIVVAVMILVAITIRRRSHRPTVVHFFDLSHDGKNGPIAEWTWQFGDQGGYPVHPR
jgi:hypothetical protein